MDPRTPTSPTVVRRAAAAALLTLVLVASACGGDGSPAPPKAALTTAALDWRAFPDRGRPLREPPVRRSRHGLLRATLTVADRVVDVAGTPVRAKTYDGGFVGPTLHVRPGDTLELRVVNRLGEPTNLHEDGFHVSPIGIADSVLRTIPADSTDAVRVRIPATMAPGTYWYHPHVHGLVEEQVFSGLSGVIIVEGLHARLPPALRHVPDHLFALKDLQVRGDAIVGRHIDSGAPTTRTVGGQLQPVLGVRTNRVQLLRLANVGADIWYRLALDGATFRVIAEDGNPVGRVWQASRLLLPPGKRFDVLVRWPHPGTYRLRTLAMSTGPAGDSYPRATLATIRVAGAPVPTHRLPRSLGPEPHLDRAKVDRVRHMTFGENGAGTRYFIDGRPFDARRVDQVVRLGATEEWVIHNATRELHPFHIHGDDFQVVAVDGWPHHARSLQDTVVLPVGRTVRIRLRFRGFTGAFVYHCTILAHEDAGMMGVVAVTRDGRRTADPRGRAGTREPPGGRGRTRRRPAAA
jgi:FtsP/CotA-like multicopper oxidase with cupredoxin domain